MKALDRVKIKTMMEALAMLAPDLEIKLVEKAVFDKKEWFGILVREKKAKNDVSGSSDKH